MAQISIRVDDEIKHRAEETLNVIGISMSTAINVFLRTVARENRIPFELSVDPFYSKENMDRLSKIAADINNGTAQLVAHDLIEE